MRAKKLDFLDFPNYSIDCSGRVLNLKTGKYLLGQKNSKSGYWSVQLSNKGKKKRLYIHRIVAMAFLDNPENKATVNHINGNLDDNTIENLEWATQQENSDHSYRELDRRKNTISDEVRKKGVEKNSKSIAKMDLNGKVVKTYPSLIEASREERVSRHSIRDVINGKKESHKGFAWKFI